MTDRRIPNAADRWRATVEALEDIVLADSGEAEADAQIDAAAVARVRGLIRFLLAGERRRALSPDQARQPGSVIGRPALEVNEPEVNEPPDRRPRAWPAWRE